MDRETKIGLAIVLLVVGFGLLFTVSVVVNGWASALQGWATFLGIVCVVGAVGIITNPGGRK